MNSHFVVVVLLLAIIQFGDSNDTDRFNYRGTSGTDYGPEEWDEITCTNPGECQGWPDSWELGVGWELGSKNNCASCPADRNNADNRDCGMHRQSPINLERTQSTTGHDTECYDYHWMAYENGSCKWDDIIDNKSSRDRNNFKIERHALQILQPINDKGKLQCKSKKKDKEPMFPRLDYSKGFPDWWFLSHTEVTVPSEHTQHGKQYDAEVHLSHFYSVKHSRKIGKVAIFLQEDQTISRRWNFLDKLICQWREVEEKTRKECNMESVPSYPRCRNPTRAGNSDETNPGGNHPATPVPNQAPTQRPVQQPTRPPTPSDTEPSTRCPAYENDKKININRICSGNDGGCCDPARRSASKHCHSVYSFFGENMGKICTDCCMKELAPPPPSHNTHQPIDCSTIDSPFRMCKPSSCCEEKKSKSSWCKGTYKKYGDQIGSICWYCCSQPKEVDPSLLTIKNPPQTRPTPAQAPTRRPTQVIVPPPSPSSAEPPIKCPNYKKDEKINMDRICKVGGCCDSVRSASEHCHFVYSLFGGNMGEICTGCCMKELAPPPPLHNTHRWIDCSTIDNPLRICKSSSCCEEKKSNSRFCKRNYKRYGDTMGSICWYCCRQPKEVDPSLLSINAAAFPPRKSPSESLSVPTRLPFFDLVVKRTSTSAPTLEVNSGVTPTTRVSITSSNADKSSNYSMNSLRNNSHRFLLSSSVENEENMSDKVIKAPVDENLLDGLWVNDLNMDPSNFVVNENTEAEYLENIENHRKLNEPLRDNYKDVKYSPYEWMREVKTEYYYRYEGSQMVPPCYETVHYRVMKDPIRIHPIQLAELERLLAWRIAPKGSKFNECKPDTAGRQRSGSNRNAVDLNRPIQEYQTSIGKFSANAKIGNRNGNKIRTGAN
eukprot:CAMPEP_0194129910 /NCGR_PEP_ID=MMETSP0152-20130528/1095_1 /TAXON_ID=1049557 /ORGANISM="Thalassiothrix antarctica, Strain L6-D1" /LENGTH=886 /DNA_ID=CAMNT_0038824291 /DNA_START=312 /DNA_END=2973 /DNA_ORIENTATION=-